VTRRIAVLLGGLLLAAAGPHRALPPPASPPLPLPPPLPTDPPMDLAAPMPDDSLGLPTGPARNQTTTWAPQLYRMQDLSSGEGYIPGSAYQAPEQRKPIQTPGFMVTVPLQ
jgi:hypothetical protein